MRIPALVLAICAITGLVAAAERPNILWLTAEDMSAHLGCYGDAEARTPRLDALARNSVRYTRAFATAPVCSPARCCLITGM
jgi:N-sulfoglucosamine sulfohydrolase